MQCLTKCSYSNATAARPQTAWLVAGGLKNSNLFYRDSTSAVVVISMCDAGCSCEQNSIECTGLRTREANPNTCKNVQHLNIDDIEILSHE